MTYQEERQWRTKSKHKLIHKASKAKTFKSFSQIMDVIGKHNVELVKIDKILKDGKAWA